MWIKILVKYSPNYTLERHFRDVKADTLFYIFVEAMACPFSFFLVRTHIFALVSYLLSLRKIPLITHLIWGKIKLERFNPVFRTSTASHILIKLSDEMWELQQVFK